MRIYEDAHCTLEVAGLDDETTPVLQLRATCRHCGQGLVRREIDVSRTPFDDPGASPLAGVLGDEDVQRVLTHRCGEG